MKTSRQSFFIILNIILSDVSKSQAKRLAKRKKMHPDNLKSITEKLQDESDDEELSGDDGNYNGL